MSSFLNLFPAHREAGAAILPSEGRLPPFEGATGWLNSEPLTPEGLRGRVVAVQFWTYTCVNWLRTLPYVREWAAKYHDQGLSVIGVHTPEFGFERNVDNVIAAARDMRVDYPIALDSNYAVWRAFANHYWPALYIADEQGRIRYHHFGEGAYAMSEMAVQQLLREAGMEGFDPQLVSVNPQGTEVAADWTNVRTPETYLSYGRSYGFASPDGERFDEPHDYPEPSRLSLNQDEGESLAQITKATPRIACCSQPWSSSGIRRDRARRRPWSLRSSPKTSTTRTIILEEETTLWRTTICT